MSTVDNTIVVQGARVHNLKTLMSPFLVISWWSLQGFLEAENLHSPLTPSTPRVNAVIWKHFRPMFVNFGEHGTPRSG